MLLKIQWIFIFWMLFRVWILSSMTSKSSAGSIMSVESTTSGLSCMFLLYQESSGQTIPHVFSQLVCVKSLSPQNNESDLNNGPYLMHNAVSNCVSKLIPQHVFYMHGGPNAATGFMLLEINLKSYWLGEVGDEGGQVSFLCRSVFFFLFCFWMIEAWRSVLNSR